MPSVDANISGGVLDLKLRKSAVRQPVKRSIAGSISCKIRLPSDPTSNFAERASVRSLVSCKSCLFSFVRSVRMGCFDGSIEAVNPSVKSLATASVAAFRRFAKKSVKREAEEEWGRCPLRG